MSMNIRTHTHTPLLPHTCTLKNISSISNTSPGHLNSKSFNWYYLKKTLYLLHSCKIKYIIIHKSTYFIVRNTVDAPPICVKNHTCICHILPVHNHIHFHTSLSMYECTEESTNTFKLNVKNIQTQLLCESLTDSHLLLRCSRKLPTWTYFLEALTLAPKKSPWKGSELCLESHQQINFFLTVLRYFITLKIFYYPQKP